MSARLYTLDPVEGFLPKSFGGHRDVVLGAYFSADEKTVGCLYMFTTVADSARYTLFLEMGRYLLGKPRRQLQKMTPTRRYLSSMLPPPPPRQSIIQSSIRDGVYPIGTTSINPVLELSAPRFMLKHRS
jgi:hypothetical protein